jgi:DivIVA domain-containing protein
VHDAITPIAMMKTTGTAPTTAMTRGVPLDHLSRHVRRTFPRALRGYSVPEVDAHLEAVRGWFTLGGFDRLVAEHREELLGSAVREAEATVETARREAETITAEARRDAEAVLAEATRQAAATTEAAEQRLKSLKTLASAILDEAERHA